MVINTVQIVRTIFNLYDAHCVCIVYFSVHQINKNKMARIEGRNNEGRRRQTRRQVAERKENERWGGMARVYERQAQREGERKEVAAKKLDEMRKEIAELRKEIETINDKTSIHKCICNFLFCLLIVFFCMVSMGWYFVVVVDFQ